MNQFQRRVVRPEVLSRLPAFALATACCAWPPTAARDHKIRKGATGDEDWTALAAIAIRQLLAQVQMFLKAKRAIDKYIVEA